MKPTFLFLMFNGSMQSIAMRIKDEGYPIKIWISPDAAKASSAGESGGKYMGRGIFDSDEMVKDYFEVINKKKPEELVIIVDDNSGGHQIDLLRKLGYKVVGGGSWIDKLEYERSYGNEVAEEIGLKLPKTFQFTSLRLARKFISKLPEETKFVFKAEGSEYAGSSKTYTAKNITDLASYLDWLYNDSKEKHYQLDNFELQSFVDGYEADFSGYFNGEEFVEGSCCLCFEMKKVGDSLVKSAGVGQASGCMGQVLFFLKDSKYFDTYIKKLTPYLKEAGYIGQIAINNIISKKDNLPYFLEFTPRFGYDSFFGETHIHQTSGMKLSDFFLNLVNKKPIEFNYGLISAAARVYCNAPGHEDKDTTGRLFTFDPAIEKNLWFYAVSINKDQYTIDNGVVLVAVSAKPKLEEARKDLYENVVDKINLSDIYFRSQICDGVAEKVQALKKMGWV